MQTQALIPQLKWVETKGVFPNAKHIQDNKCPPLLQILALADGGPLYPSLADRQYAIVFNWLRRRTQALRQVYLNLKIYNAAIFIITVYNATEILYEFPQR